MLAMAFRRFLPALFVAASCTQASAQANCPSINVVVQRVTGANCGINNGAVRIFTPTGGVGPYTFSWNTVPARTSQNLLGVLPGTYTVTITDRNGCAVNRSFTIPVAVDITAPTITCAPDAVVTTDAGRCGANIKIEGDRPIDYRMGDATGGTEIREEKGGPWAGSPENQIVLPRPRATDGCSAVWITGSRSDGRNLQTEFPLGVTTITWTARDAAGNTSTCTQRVTVVDNEVPRINNRPTNVTVSASAGSCQATVNWNPPTATDNCSVVMTASHQPGATFPVGTTTVTYTARDNAGNTTVHNFTVTVRDTERPVLSCPGQLNFATNASGCTWTGAISTPAATDNCGTATVTGSRSDGRSLAEPFPIGTTTIMWRAVDAAGNMSSCSQVVAVRDGNLPVLTVPANITACDNGAGNNYTLQASATDACSPVTISYVMTMGGVTIGSASSNTIQANFAVGTTAVTWFARDAGGNQVSGVTLVTIQSAPVATITAGPLDPFCNRVVLSGSGGGTYQWLLNGQPVASSQVLNVGPGGHEPACATGQNCTFVYQLLVNNGNACGNSAPATYVYTPGYNYRQYTIIGLNQVQLAADNFVQSGGVGVNNAGGTATVSGNSTINAAGATLTAPSMTVSNTASVPNRVTGTAGFQMPTHQTYSGGYSGLSNFRVSAGTTTTLSSNYQDLYIERNATVTLSGTTFRSVTVEEGATVIFTATTLNMQNFTLGNGATGGIARARFANHTNLRISRQLIVGFGSVFNQFNSRVVVHMGNELVTDQVLVRGQAAIVNAVILAPTGDIRVGNCVGSQMITNPTSTSCTQSNSCINVVYQGYQQLSNGNYTLTYRIQNTCRHAVSNMAFEVPSGNAAAWTRSNTAQSYSAENTTNNPFRSLKLNVNGEGIKDGQTETITYTITPGAFFARTTLRVSVKYSTTEVTFTFPREGCGAVTLPTTCAPTSMNGLFVGRRVTGERWVNWNGLNCSSSTTLRTMETRTEETKTPFIPAPKEVTEKEQPEAVAAPASALAFPNPSKGTFQLQLKGFSAGPVQVQIYNSNGVAVMSRQLVHNNSEQVHPLQLPVVGSGLYTIRANGAKEQAQTRIMITQ